MDLVDQVVSQLQTEIDESFETIGHAWTVKPVAQLEAALPAAWAYLDGIDMEASPFATQTIQSGDYRVAVLIVCKVADLETSITSVREALQGFQPTDGSWDVFELVSGSTLDINESVVWWRALFAVRRYHE